MTNANTNVKTTFNAVRTANGYDYTHVNQDGAQHKMTFVWKKGTRGNPIHLKVADDNKAVLSLMIGGAKTRADADKKARDYIQKHNLRKQLRDWAKGKIDRPMLVKAQ
tara:strand:- start:116 stop:439 length:324 start_codon:yes stop_codon:yes gene_type:complete